MAQDATTTRLEATYGAPPAELAPDARGEQVSPLTPGATAIEALAEGSLRAMTVLAPPGTLERRYVLAHALRALGSGGRLTALAPKDRGGSRREGGVGAVGCTGGGTGERHPRTRAPP